MCNVRRFFFLVLCLVGIGANAGEVATETFRSESLKRDYTYKVYLPDGYRNERFRYPVLYLLHGSGGNENDWLEVGGLRQTMDSLIDRRLVRPMVVVMPGHTGAWWVDGATEKGETALVKELIPHAESKYRIGGSRDFRLIAGTSAGGYGSLNVMLKYPHLVAAAAILSPAIYDRLPPANSSALRLPQFQTHGKFDAVLWKSLSHVSHIDAYKASGTIVPLYIGSGDHDMFGIALQAATLYEALRLHQPKAIELRVVDGDHAWMVFRDLLADALPFMNAHVVGPR